MAIYKIRNCFPRYPNRLFSWDMVLARKDQGKCNTFTVTSLCSGHSPTVAILKKHAFSLRPAIPICPCHMNNIPGWQSKRRCHGRMPDCTVPNSLASLFQFYSIRSRKNCFANSWRSSEFGVCCVNNGISSDIHDISLP